MSVYNAISVSLTAGAIQTLHFYGDTANWFETGGVTGSIVGITAQRIFPGGLVPVIAWALPVGTGINIINDKTIAFNLQTPAGANANLNAGDMIDMNVSIDGTIFPGTLIITLKGIMIP